MIPSGSWPGIIGSPRVPIAPLYCSTSDPQMPQASTRSSAPSSGPITGRGYSRISICRGPVWTTARTMSAIHVLSALPMPLHRTVPGSVGPGNSA